MATGDEWGQVLGTLASLRAQLDRLEYEVVATVRAQGATWEDIGKRFGISRQAARSKWGQPRRRR